MKSLTYTSILMFVFSSGLAWAGADPQKACLINPNAWFCETCHNERIESAVQGKTYSEKNDPHHPLHLSFKSNYVAVFGSETYKYKGSCIFTGVEVSHQAPADEDSKMVSWLECVAGNCDILVDQRRHLRFELNKQ